MNPFLNAFRLAFATAILNFCLTPDGHSQCDPGLVSYSIVLADASETAFPTDISWFITSEETGALIGQFCPDYTGGTFEVCLIPGEQYTFIAWDDFGDGWGFPEGTIAWSILYPNGEIAFAGESPSNSEPGDFTENCIGFDEEFSLTFTAVPAFDCTPPVISIETERNCNESNFDAILTIEEPTPGNFPLFVAAAEINGVTVGLGTAANLAGQTVVFNDLPLDTDIIFISNTLGVTCPETEIVRVSSEDCFVSLTCGEGSETTYCYEDFDDSVFAYQSPDGEPVSLIFTEGFIEQCCDFIFIYEGLDDSGELLFAGNNNGNLANLSVTADSGEIFMKISSDFLGSCVSGVFGGSEWTWVVGCGEFDVPGCTDPAAFNFNPQANVDNGSCLPVAANDEACGALPLACNEAPLTGNFDTTTAGPELDDCISPFLPSDGDLWFVFESDGTSLYTIADNSGLNPAVGLYTGDDCENLNEVEICPDFGSSITGNFPAGTYYFLVRPFGGGWISNYYSVSLTCNPNCSEPFPAVEEESLTTTSENRRVIASWSPVETQIGCQTQIREAGGDMPETHTVGGADASSYTISVALLQLGTDFEWRVRCGCSQTPLVAGPWSSWQPFTTPGGFGIAVNPNPTTGSSNVSFTAVSEEYATLEVYDMSGRLVIVLFAGVVQPHTDYRFEFDGSALPNGVYIYRLNTETESVNEKFIIAR